MKKSVFITGLLGLIAAVIVGVGEYLLHYDPQARFASGGYDFLLGISDQRSTRGHFFGVLGATLYPFGCYHIYLMLKPANAKVAFAAFLIGSFGFIVGTVWIGSRASISALTNIPATPEVENLIALYDLRFTTLVVSIIFIWLTLTGRSEYRKWMALFSPVVLILFNFAIYLVAPSIGKHMMPIALNIAFFIFFALSLLHVAFPKQQSSIS